MFQKRVVQTSVEPLAIHTQLTDECLLESQPIEVGKIPREHPPNSITLHEEAEALQRVVTCSGSCSQWVANRPDPQSPSSWCSFHVTPLPP